MIELTGDLLQSNLPAIGHGVNCKGFMGAGIARAFREHHPDLYESYKQLCLKRELNPGEMQSYRVSDTRLVYNMASQDKPGPDARYEWLTSSLVSVCDDMTERGITQLGLPRIGCGIGGLDWEIVKSILEYNETVYKNIEITIYSL